MMLKKSVIADLSLLLVAFIWGSTFVIVQKAIHIMPPHFFNGIRFLAAAIILSVICLTVNRSRPSKETLLAGMALGSFLFLGYGFQTVGLLYTTSTKAGFITGLSVIIVPLLSIWLLSERARKTVYFASALGTIGLYLLTLSDFSTMNIGDLLVLFCAIAFALHIIFTAKYSGNHDAWMLTIIQLTTVSLLSFIASAMFESQTVKENFRSMFTFDVLFALVITAVFATAFAFFVQTKLQQYTTAARVALIYATEPVFAALTAFLYIGDRLSSFGLIGCFLILAAMAAAEWKYDRGKKSLSS